MKSVWLLCAAALPVAAHAQQYPAKPVRAVVAFAAGGFADTVARLIGGKAAERLGQPVIVENRGGAGGNIAARAVAQSPADGYTLLVHTAAFAINPSLYKDPGYSLEDFAPISNTGSAPGLFAINASNPARSMRDFVQASKGRRVTYATAGVGTSSHLAADYILRIVAGLDAVHVPYQGGAPALTAAVSGQVDVVSLTMTPAVPFLKSGKLRGLALSSLTHVDALPDVPTMGQAGLGDFEERSWVGFFAPAKTPGDAVNRVNAEINQALKQADVREKFASLGLDAHPGSAAQFTGYVRNEVAKWAKVVKATGITLE